MILETENKQTSLLILSNTANLCGDSRNPNAVLIWNTVRIGEIVGALEGTTSRGVAPEDLARVSPLASAHVIPSG